MAEILYRSQCILGEAPVWDSSRQSCFWADIESRTIYEYNWSSHNTIIYALEHRVSLIIPAPGNVLILGLQGGIAQYHLDTRKLRWLSDLDTDWSRFRCNDGGCDASGRIWVSTTELNHEAAAGAIYSFGKEAKAIQKISGISIPNGIVWSADQKKMYYTDSIKREVYAWHADAATGNITFDKTVIQIPDGAGLPDGMAVDAEGMIWIALWDGYGLGRFNPETGAQEDFIAIPAPQVTSCCFAGKDLDHLVITTARKGLSGEVLQKYPESGNVFIVKTKVKGIIGNAMPDL